MKPALSESMFGRAVRISAALIVACSSSIHAQSTQSPRIFQGVEVGTGIFEGKGTEPYDKGFGISAMVQGKLQWKGSEINRALALINITGFVVPDMTDDCTVTLRPDGTFGGCLPDFPSGVAVSTLVGVERRIAPFLAAGVYGGPAMYFIGHASDRLGLQTRVDLTMPANEHAAFVLWGQYGYVPLGNGARGRIPMVGAGVRFR